MSPAAPSGLLVVDKPGGLTSHDVVARVRRLAGTRKVGHAGTLDPMATGVLLLAVGRGTRLLGHLALTDKRYDATIRLGATTTSDDADGEVTSTTRAAHLAHDDVAAALAALSGEIDQVPSAVSAIKVGGRRAHERVRSGEEVALAARRVRVHELTCRAIRAAGDGLEVDVSVHCSSGTYVRAIARDLGARLRVGGHLTALRRTAVGSVTLDDATPLADLEAAGTVALEPLPVAVRRFFPTTAVDVPTAAAVAVGRPLPLDLPEGGPVALLGPDGSFLALYRAGEPARPVAVFV